MASTNTELLKIMVPKPCPVPLIRIGGIRDGGYLVPNDLKGVEACFSPGVNNTKNFEDQLAVDFSIKSHMCDFSSDISKLRTPLVEGMQTFDKKWLDPSGDENSISLKEWVDRHSPNSRQDLMLQMDIEGGEYKNITSMDEPLLKRFRIIVIELHGLKAFMRDDLPAKEIGPLLLRIDSTHVCVHAHANNCCNVYTHPATGMNIPNVIELTFLRRDRFIGNASKYIEPQLPHPLDILRNARGKPPIHLNELWLDSQCRSVESRLKILEDQLSFSEWEASQLRKAAK